MRVLLKLTLECDPDAAWRALLSPTVFREVAMPFLDYGSLEPGGFPTTWTEGSHPAELRAFGLIGMGMQRLDLHVERRSTSGRGAAALQEIRMLRDSGGGLTGALTVLPRVDHRMAVSAHPDGPGPDGQPRTLYRDRLIVNAGALTPVVWYGLWAFWQWRGVRLRQLAPTWAYDPPVSDAAAAEADAGAGADAEADAGADEGAAGTGTDEGQS